MSRDYSLTGPESEAAKASGLAMADWYRTPVERKRMKELMQRSDGPALRDTILWFALMLAFAIVGALTWLSWVSVVCFLCYGVLYGSGADARWHECGHGTAFRTRWMNDVVYQVACFMMMRNPVVWRWSHARHHTDTIIVGRDPEIITGRPPNLLKLGLNLFGLVDAPVAVVAMFRHMVGRLTPNERDFIPESELGKVKKAAWVWFVIYAATAVVALTTRSVIPFLLVGLPRFYGAWHHIMTGVIQHLGLFEDVTDFRINSRTCYMNPVSRFIYWNMNYHLEHHMYPMVPYHRLPELHEEIRHDCPPPTPGIYSALREIVPCLLEQRGNPSAVIDRRPLLPTA